MSPRVKWSLLAGVLALAVGCLGFAIGNVASTPAACRDAVIAVDAVFEVMPTPGGDATQGELIDQMIQTRIRADKYSELRAECLR